jgi:hypothetical protein
MMVMFRTAKSKSSIELGRWNIVVLTAALFAGTFICMSAAPITKTLGFYSLEMPLIEWLLLGVYSMGAPWLLGRAISRT